LGIRICGLRSFQPKKNEYVVKDKPWGKKVKDTTMTDSIGLFFNNGESLRKDVVKAFLPKLKQVEEWFKSQKKFKILFKFPPFLI